MDNVERKNDSEDYVFPQLTRFNAIKASIERLWFGTATGLESTVNESIGLKVEKVHDESDSPVASKVRISVTISYDAKWRQKETEEQVAIFSGTYRSIFNFADDIAAETVNEYISKKIYRDFLVAQAYPLAQSHMLSELKMIGINAIRKLGYDVYNGEFVPGDLSAPVTAKKLRSKKKALPNK